MLNTDRVSSILILAVSAVFWSQLRGVHRFGAVFPRAILTALMVLAAALLIKSFVAPDSPYKFKKIELSRVGIAVLVIAAWVILVPIFGFFVTSVVMYNVLIAAVDAQARKPRVLAVSAGVGFLEISVFYYVFARLLIVPLPKGMFF